MKTHPADPPIRLLSSLLDDVRAHLPESGRSGLGPAVWLRIAATSPGFRLTATYRLGHSARGRLGFAGRGIASFLFGWGRHRYGCSIDPTARIEGGLILPHPLGIVVGPGARVGPRAWIFQNVTIGGSPGREGMPRIGGDARIFAGAVIAGPVEVGEGAVIGANAVVSRDIPPRSIARPSPILVLPLPPGGDVPTADRP